MKAGQSSNEKGAGEKTNCPNCIQQQNVSECPVPIYVSLSTTLLVWFLTEPDDAY